MKYLFFFILTVFVFLPVSTQEFDRLRENMVKNQIEKRGIKDKNTLDAMRKVERHLFVPEKVQKNAYDDSPLPIGYGQTISQPYIVAYMTSLIEPKAGDKVLEIGTGSGYQAAILAEIVNTVYSMEIVSELGTQAKNRLSKLGYKNVEVIIGDGYNGHPDKGPFDAIVVTAAAEHIPPPLIEQLKDGGKMIIPVGSPFMVQTLILVEKNGKEIKSTNLMAVRFVPFTRSKN
jgi:protein-L-isoaspartate(D-aspartate) O-methyltransferase